MATGVTYGPNSLIGKTNGFDPFSSIPSFPSTNAVLQPRKSTFSATTLGLTQKVYTSKSQLDIQAINLWAANQGYSFATEEGPGQIFSTTLTIPYDEITNIDDLVTELVQWEITENVVNRDLFDAGIFTTNNSGQLGNIRYTVPPLVRVAIKEALRYGNWGTLNFSQLNKNLTQTQVNNLAPLLTISNQFFNLLKSGVTSVKSATIHLKRVAVFSTNDPNIYDTNPYFQHILTANNFQVTNINPIIGRADLINLFHIEPITANQLLPSYIIPKSIANPPFNDPITQFALGGYLVHFPIVKFLTPTKVELTQLFEFDEWLDTVYPRFSPISQFPQLYPTPYPPGYSGIGS